MGKTLALKVCAKHTPTAGFIRKPLLNEVKIMREMSRYHSFPKFYGMSEDPKWIKMAMVCLFLYLSIDNNIHCVYFTRTSTMRGL